MKEDHRQWGCSNKTIEIFQAILAEMTTAAIILTANQKFHNQLEIYFRQQETKDNQLIKVPKVKSIALFNQSKKSIIFERSSMMNSYRFLKKNNKEKLKEKLKFNPFLIHKKPQKWKENSEWKEHKQVIKLLI